MEAISHPRGRWKPTKFHSGTRSFLFCEERRFSLMIGKNTQDVFDVFCFPVPWKRQYRQVPIMSSSWKVAIMSRAFFKKKNTRKSISHVYSLFCYYTRFLCEMITSLDATIRLQSPWTIANLAYCCKSVGSYVPVVIWAGTKALYGSTPPWRFAIYSFCQIGAICGIRPLQTHAPLSRTLHVFFKHIYSKDFMLFHLNRA